MVASLRKVSPRMPVMVRVDTEYTASLLDGEDVTIVISPFKIPLEVEKPTLYHNRGAILAKIEVAGEAVAKWGNTLLVDSDIIFLKPTFLPKGATDAVLSWGSRGKRPSWEDGKFNAGMLWIGNPEVVTWWKEATLSNLGGFYEQGCLDFLHDKFNVKVFSENHNWGWWRHNAIPIPKNVRSVHFHMIRNFDHQMGSLVSHTNKMREWIITSGYLSSEIKKIFHLPEEVSIHCKGTLSNIFLIMGLRREGERCGVKIHVNGEVCDTHINILQPDSAWDRDGVIPSKESIRALHFRLFGYFSNHADIIAYTYANDCGLGEAAISNIDVMEEMGISVERRFWKGSLEDEPALYNPKQIYYHHWHPQRDEKTKDWKSVGFGHGAKHVAFWAYETEASLPKEFMGLAPYLSAIWTPSTFCKDIFSVTNLPVSVIPHNVKSKPLEPLPYHKTKVLTVLFVFDAWSTLERKNPLAVVRVFKKAFKDSKLKVRLILKGHHLRTEDVARLRGHCDDRMTLINFTVTGAAMDRLFSQADILLSLQRSEGFGLNIAKSLARGIPVVTTGYGGHLDFCNKKNTFLIGYKMVNVKSSGGKFYREGRWASPDEGEAVRTLMKVAKKVVSNDTSLLKMRQRGVERMSKSNKSALGYEIGQFIT